MAMKIIMRFTGDQIQELLLANPLRAPALAELIGQLEALDCHFHCWTDLTAAVDARQEPLSTYQRPQGLMRI